MNDRKTNNILSNLIDQQSKSIDYLTLSGGGAKGALYTGVYQALENSAILTNIIGIAGSSAGAITAAFIATNTGAENFIQISDKTNFKNLLGNSILPFNRDGNPLYELMQNSIKENVNRFLNSNPTHELLTKRFTDLELTRDNFISEKQIFDQVSNRLEEKLNNTQNLTTTQITKFKTELQDNFDKNQIITSQLKNIDESFDQLLNLISLENSSSKSPIAELLERSKKDDSKITFKDLKLLRLLNPQLFKELYITAVNKDSGELEIFNSTNTPDLEIALAVRASVSIPLVVKPAKINNTQYVDGGYRDNIPLNYFNNQHDNFQCEEITTQPEKMKIAKNNGKTLAFAFGSERVEDSATIAIYSSRDKITNYNSLQTFILDVVVKFLGKFSGKFKYTEDDEKTHQNLRNNALNSVVLDTKDISTLSFGKAKKKADYLQVKGYHQTMNHLYNHDLVIGSHNFKAQNFLLNVYENIPDSHSASWADRVRYGKIDNLQLKADLLSYCRIVEDSKESSKQILLAAVNILANNNGKISNSSFGIETLIKQLNDPKCPNIIKTEFIEILSSDFDRKSVSNIKDFKFTNQHFDSFIKSSIKSEPDPQTWNR